MRTTTIIVIILFLFASIFLVVFAVKLKGPGPEANLTTNLGEAASSTSSTSGSTESSLQDNTSSSIVSEEKSSGIEKIEVYLDGIKDGGGIFLGEAKYGLPSPETSALYGEKFADSGYSLSWTNTNYNFVPGSVHNLYVYSFIPKFGWDYSRQTVTIPGEKQISPNIKFYIDTPANGSVISADTNIGGWAINTTVSDSPGISSVEFFIDGPKGFGKQIGSASLGAQRADVAQATNNPAYTNCGFNYMLSVNILQSGTDHTIYAYANSTTGESQEIVLDLKIAGQKESENSIIFTENNFASEISKGTVEIKGWAVSKDLFEENIIAAPQKDFSVKKIVFTSAKSGNEDIFTMDIDGSGLTQLTDNPANDMYPQVSPDGRKILYTADINGTWQIMIMNFDGSGKKQLTNSRYRAGYPTMSFDGKYIFYEVFIDNNWEIFRINSDGSNPVRLTFNPAGDDWHPFAHPFEFKIIFESGAVGSENIYFMDFDGSNITMISDFGVRKRTPNISKDGKYIAFAGYEQNLSSIYIMNSDGLNITRLTNNAGFDTHPTISPDDKLIAFDSNVSGNSEIYIMNFDGSNIVKLTDIAGDDWGPIFIYQQ
ncbi:DUF5050 domain-containing protein [bacterium]|nr:DUF5050 domain-containing protein [bacterium]